MRRAHKLVHMFVMTVLVGGLLGSLSAQACDACKEKAAHEKNAVNAEQPCHKKDAEKKPCPLHRKSKDKSDTCPHEKCKKPHTEESAQ